MYSFVNVHKRYGLRTVALRKINLDIQKRSFFVLYGPAGAGKSTMLNLLGGITRPTSGDIQRDGVSLLPLPPERRDAAMAFENYALYSHLSVGENLAFPLKARKMSLAEVEDRVKRVSGMLGIGHLLDRRPGFLSGGQRQRVALGRAIIRPADIYLLDEPIGHLDAKLRHQMRAELKALAQDLNATVVFTTTSSREALALGDRIAVLNLGKLEQVGTPAELYHRPENAFVASFIGDPPMSFVSVRVTGEGKSVGLTSLAGEKIVSDEHFSRFSKLDDLKAGFRAEAVSLGEAGKPGTIAGQVSVVEHLGYANIAVVNVGGDQVSISLPTTTSVRAGDRVGVAIDPGKFQLFQGEKALEGRA
ncbi:ABC transporter ATP-binding protein [Brucellaceae bacterium VT-16-1752]|nr:ABC transporter ATP-binding protein [Brucellaceae bacterium VT-16-1752]